MAKYPAWVKQMAAGIDPAKDFGVSYSGYSGSTRIEPIAELSRFEYLAQVPGGGEMLSELQEAIAVYRRFGTSLERDAIEGIEGRIAETLGVSRWESRSVLSA